MPNKISEDMSNKISEDLLVRNYINVIMGIIRKKYFFFSLIFY